MLPFAKDLANGILSPVYVLVSAEPLLISRALKAISDAAVPENMRGWNQQIFDGRGGKGVDVLAAAQTLPMMGDRRLVIVRGVHQMAAAELAILIDYLKDPNPRASLVLTAPKVDKRIKFFATARKVKYFYELSAPRRLGGWLESEANDRGIDIERGASRRLLDVVGKDLSRLSMALEQLSLYANGRPITCADVDELIATTRESSVFELTDAIGAGNRQRAFTAIASLVDQRQSTLGVVIMLARHIRQLCLTGDVVARSGPRAVARELKVPPFVADKLIDQARRYQPDKLLVGLGRLSWADRACKGMSPRLRTLGKPLGERLILEELANTLIDLAR